MWAGEIIAPKQDACELSSLSGVMLGEYDDEHQEFSDCHVTDEGLDALDPHWGRWYWCLYRVEVN